MWRVFDLSLLALSLYAVVRMHLYNEHHLWMYIHFAAKTVFSFKSNTSTVGRMQSGLHEDMQLRATGLGAYLAKLC